LALLFAGTVFLNAALLFALEPLIAKMILPRLGGTPAVWNTCMVFFQAVLLAGYLGAHSLSRLRTHLQAVLVGVLQLAVFLVLPVHLADNLSQAVPHEANPIPWLLSLLCLAVGLPFFVLAATGPLLQKWFAATTHAAAGDPYFLYGASNLGSMLALLSYPWLVEPKLRLVEQTWYWAGAYGILVVLTVGIGVMLRQSGIGVRGQGSGVNGGLSQKGSDPSKAKGGQTPFGIGPEERGSSPSLTPDPRPVTPVMASDLSRLTATRRMRWLVLAFVPSSLMLGVTMHLSTDIAAIPLLWIIPLALYLLSFILVFARRSLVSRRIVGRMLPVGILLLILTLLCDDMQPPIAVLIGIHLLTFLAAALFCHGELSADRPSPSHLTEYYLWLAVGGIMGGLFNALLAPLIFNRVVEYPLVVVVLCLLRPRPSWWKASALSRKLDLVLPVGLGCLTAGLVWGLQNRAVEPAHLKVGLMFGLPAVAAYTFVDRPLRFALGVGALLAGGVLYTGAHGRALYTERSFFGVLRVTVDPTGTFRQLVHGNTVHGRQRIDSDSRPEPLTYYHRTGPMGQVFEWNGPRLSGGRVAVVGLGVGSLAWYATPGQEWTFYEIDPAVQRLASNPSYFTFLQECRASKLDVVLGDARLRLEEAPEGHFDLIALDAFSSDAVPVHLITREAVELYLDKLAPGGLLAFHISNRYLDLKAVLGNLAHDPDLTGRYPELTCRYREDLEVSAEEKASGKSPSQWAVMARSPADLGRLVKSIRWLPLAPGRNGAVWTDDFSNLLGIVKWHDWEVD
jgi:SAM-dependent methyltransferase